LRLSRFLHLLVARHKRCKNLETVSNSPENAILGVPKVLETTG